MDAIPALSNSGPSAAIFFSPDFPTRPLTREVSNQSATSELQRSSSDLDIQISKEFVGRIWSSVSTTIKPPR